MKATGTLAERIMSQSWTLPRFYDTASLELARLSAERAIIPATQIDRVAKATSWIITPVEEVPVLGREVYRIGAGMQQANGEIPGPRYEVLPQRARRKVDPGSTLKVEVVTPHELDANTIGETYEAFAHLAPLHNTLYDKRKATVVNPTTGLLNKEGLLYLRDELARKATYTDGQLVLPDAAMLLMDLHLFKGVNRTAGWDKGTELIKQAANHINAFGRDRFGSDAYRTFHFHGDEFAAIAFGVQQQEIPGIVADLVDYCRNQTFEYTRLDTHNRVRIPIFLSVTGAPLAYDVPGLQSQLEGHLTDQKKRLNSLILKDYPFLEARFNG